MTSRQQLIHDRALSILSQQRKSEFELLQIFQEAESLKVHRSLGYRSLFQYAVKGLKLAEPRALALISVARKSQEIPELRSALKNGDLCVARANRIVSILNRENASELIQLAATLSWREMEKEIAKRNPKAASPDRIKVLSEKIAQMLVAIPVEDLKDFERIASLEAQRTSRSPSHGEILHVCFQAYLEKNDPVRKAERAQRRSEKRIENPGHVAGDAAAPAFGASANENSARTEYNPSKPKKSVVYRGRTPLTAAERHAVNGRDRGRCTHVDEKGCRCNEDRWTDIHHVISVGQSGTNDPTNLTTLCGFHHDLVHQLSLPIDGQITWLRSPSAPYGSEWVRNRHQIDVRRHMKFLDNPPGHETRSRG